MKAYLGTKQVSATPMTRLAYNNYRNWNLPEDENGDDEGYLVEYLDGGKPNHALHEGYMLQVRSRSGLAFKHGIEAFHGTVDADFRGTVQVLLTCAHLDDDEPPVKINPGDRIAQACLVQTPRVAFETVEQLTLTERGAGGFGSTDKVAA